MQTSLVAPPLQEEILAMGKRVRELEAALRKIVELQTDDEPVAYSWGLDYFARAHAIAKAAIDGKTE